MVKGCGRQVELWDLISDWLVLPSEQDRFYIKEEMLQVEISFYRKWERAV